MEILDESPCPVSSLDSSGQLSFQGVGIQGHNEEPGMSNATVSDEVGLAGCSAQRAMLIGLMDKSRSKFHSLQLIFELGIEVKEMRVQSVCHVILSWAAFELNVSFK